MTRNKPANLQIATSARNSKKAAEAFVKSDGFPIYSDLQVQTGHMMAVRRSNYRCVGTLSPASSLAFNFIWRWK
jgi:hypothetical protein